MAIPSLSLGFLSGLLGIGSDIVFGHDRHAGVDVLWRRVRALDLRDQMIDCKRAHGYRTLDHDPLDRAVFKRLEGVGKIVEGKDFKLALHGAKLFGIEHLRHSRPADLTHAENALQLRMRAQRGLDY